MRVPRQLKSLGQILASLKPYGNAVNPRLSEELELNPTTFELQGSASPIWDTPFVAKPILPGDEVNFQAFIDGAQRTRVVYWVPLESSGALVPIVVGHIAAGVTLRDETGRLRANMMIVRDRMAIALPLTGMIDSGFKGAEVFKEWIDEGVLVHEREVGSDPIGALRLDEEGGPLILCDTTFNKLDREEADEQRLLEEWRSSEDSEARPRLLLAEALYDIGKVKSRAQGRVNTLRQILEMLILTRFRERYEGNPYILVDGPLFFLAKWLRKHQVLGSMDADERERFVLKNAVGLVKSLKARPQGIADLKMLLNLRDGEYSPLMRVSDAVDIDAEETLTRPHVTTFLRFRSPPEGLSTPNPVGLVRVDLHTSTLGVELFEEIRSDEEEARKRLGPVVRGVRRERWPAVEYKGRSYSQAFPVNETERMLHSRLYSSREMGYVYSMMRT